MTKAEFFTLVAEQVRLNSADPTEQNRILLWGDIVNRRLARNWFWDALSRDVEITLVDTQRVYPWSDITTDTDGATIIVGKLDADSVHHSGRSMVYRAPDWLDRRDPGWRTSSNTGSSQIFTIQNRSIVLEKVPDTAFVAATPKLYARASLVPAAPSSAATDTTNLEDLTPGWPEDLQELLVSGTEVWGYERQGASDYLQKRAEWLDLIEEFQSEEGNHDVDYDSSVDLPISMMGFGRIN